MSTRMWRDHEECQVWMSNLCVPATVYRLPPPASSQPAAGRDAA